MTVYELMKSGFSYTKEVLHNTYKHIKRGEFNKLKWDGVELGAITIPLGIISIGCKWSVSYLVDYAAYSLCVRFKDINGFKESNKCLTIPANYSVYANTIKFMLSFATSSAGSSLAIGLANNKIKSFINYYKNNDNGDVYRNITEEKESLLLLTPEERLAEAEINLKKAKQKVEEAETKQDVIGQNLSEVRELVQLNKRTDRDEKIAIKDFNKALQEFYNAKKSLESAQAEFNEAKEDMIYKSVRNTEKDLKIQYCIGIKYDNEILNHPNLIKDYISIHGNNTVAKLIDLCSILSKEEVLSICNNPDALEILGECVGVE